MNVLGRWSVVREQLRPRAARADAVGVADDDVVEEGNAEQGAGLADRGREAGIVGAGVGNAR